MRISAAVEQDAVDILALQRLAYRSEAELYGDRIQPLTQTIEEVREEFTDHTVLKAESGGRLVGSVRALQDEWTCFVKKLIVSPEMQGKGIGSDLTRRIEEEFPTARRFELFTGHRSERNLRLYRKLGYEEIRRQRMGGTEMVFMEKLAYRSDP